MNKAMEKEKVRYQKYLRRQRIIVGLAVFGVLIAFSAGFQVSHLRIQKAENSMDDLFPGSARVLPEKCNDPNHGKDRDCRPIAGKPVIYLYPTRPTEVNVRLAYGGTFLSTYPKYNDGWNVFAQPDGSLTDTKTGLPYSYLFWDGVTDRPYSQDEGFVVAGSDTAKFLQEKLAYLGLTPKEYNEFIVYWLPKMEHNPYNLITFAGKDYTDRAKLTITPQPDSIQRVFMVFKPLDKPADVPEQKLTPFTRHGFTVIEWGGSEAR